MSMAGTHDRPRTALGTLRVCKFRAYGAELVGLVLPTGEIRPLPTARSLGEALAGVAAGRLGVSRTIDPIQHVEVTAPIDRHEVWGVGECRESARRVAGPAETLVVRSDAGSTAPRFAVALWLGSDLCPIGLGLAIDLHARDIERERPRYSQSRLWAGSCALGPAVLPGNDLAMVDGLVLECSVDRDGRELWEERGRSTGLRASAEHVVDYLGRHDVFPDGLILLMPVPVRPPGDLRLRHGDVVTVTAEPLGTLSNPVRVGLPG
jgi:Fumarylacetoacetate (FAA) hydrolase family